MIVAALILALLTLPAMGSPDQATLTFRFEREGLSVPKYLFTVHPDGTGTFAATVIPEPPASSRYSPYPPADPAPPAHLERPITLSPQTVGDIFERVKATSRFHTGCESKAKNIAFTGTKTFSYEGPDGQGGCTYNYTEIKTVASLADTFTAIAYTLDEGRKLEQLHRYDRLGLDQEMRLLTDAQREGHAIEFGNIAPVLMSIANDPQVLERVRNRASALLASASK